MKVVSIGFENLDFNLNFYANCTIPELLDYLDFQNADFCKSDAKHIKENQNLITTDRYYANSKDSALLWVQTFDETNIDDICEVIKLIDYTSSLIMDKAVENVFNDDNDIYLEHANVTKAMAKMILEGCPHCNAKVAEYETDKKKRMLH